MNEKHSLKQRLDWIVRCLVYYANRWWLAGHLQLDKFLIRFNQLKIKIRIFGLKHGYLSPNKGNLAANLVLRRAKHDHLVQRVNVFCDRHKC